MRVCILGTCRVCYHYLPIVKTINKYMVAGQASFIYKFNVNGKDVRIYCQPINYTTKLSDARDTLKYLQGKLYKNKDPNRNLTFFNIFFRGIHKLAYDENDVKKPGEIIDPADSDNDYDLYVIEVCALREILFKTTKYGRVYLNKNLPWNIELGEEHNTFNFQKDEFRIIHNDPGRVRKDIEEICGLVNNKPILIIGPYTLPSDTNIRTAWGEIDLPDNAYVNKYRSEVQVLINEQIKDVQNIEYFDMSEEIRSNNLLVDQYHFNDRGRHILSAYILDWVKSQITSET